MHLRAQAAKASGKVALTFLPSSVAAGRIDLTYGDLVERSLITGRVLAQRFEPGQKLLLLLPAIPEFAFAFLGCLAAGLIPVPLPVPVDEGTTRRVLSAARDSAPSAIVSTQPVYDLVSVAANTGQLRHDYEWVLIDAVQRAETVPLEPEDVSEPSGDDIAFLQYTSGSTSSPRGVMVSHGSLMANEAAIRESFQVSADSTIVSWLPLHHDMGLIGGFLQPLYAGARGVILDPITFLRRPASWLEAISAEQADISGAPNFAYDLCTRTIGARKKAQLDLRNWRVAFNGAAPVFPGTLRSFSDAFRDSGFRTSSFVPCYGLAEATLLVAGRAGAASWNSRSFSVGSLESGVGREVTPDASSARELVAYPLPAHASLRVADQSTGQPVPDGVIGEIVVAGASNASGYSGNPTSSAATFGLTLPGEPGTPYVRTGDLGFILGGELFLQGRSKDVIIHRGRNLHPEDLEVDISACHRAVRAGRGAVFGMPCEGEEAIIVCQEVHNATAADHYADIADSIRRTLARNHGVSPRTVILVPPRTVAITTNGKIQRHLVAQRFRAGELKPLYTNTVAPNHAHSTSLADRLARIERSTGGGQAYSARDKLTTALCEHIRDLLGLSAAPMPEECLASLGADSLTAVQIQYEIDEALGIASAGSMALRATSISDLAAAACARPAAARSLSLPSGAGSVAYELNATQRALWFLQQASPQSTSYNITRTFRITGALEVEKLAAALGEVVRRNSSLRLSVVRVDSDPRAFIQPSHQVQLEIINARSWQNREVLTWHREFATKPFDLEHDPLVRAAVLQRDADDWLVALSLHHIACDGSSLAIIVSELAEEYRAGPGAHQPLHGSPVAEPEPSPAAYERAILDERGEELAAYWRHELAGELPRLSLPMAGPGERASGASTGFELDARQTSRLTRVARSSGLTLHNLLLSAWQVLLHRLTGQSDLLIGVPVSCRDHRRLSTWVGNLVNVVPIRSSFNPTQSFHDFARQTQQRVLDALDHRELPLSIITRIVNPDRDTASSTIFQAMFAFYSAGLSDGPSAAAVLLGDPAAALSLGAGTLHAYALPDYTAQTDVCLNVSVRRDTLAFEFQYDPAKVWLDQARQIERSFATLLDALIDVPASSLGRLPLLVAEEAAELAARSHGLRMARPVHYLRSFEETADRCPERRAADDGTMRSSYGELDQRSNHVAMRLRELGVDIDARVVVSAARCVDYLVALLGIHKADGCYVPISPREAPQRAGAMMAAVDPVVCIADPAGRALLLRAVEEAGLIRKPAVLDLQELTTGRSTRRPPRICPGWGSSYIIHTSGSTGAPKPAVSTNGGLTNHLWQMIEYFDLGPADCIGQTGPVSFDVSVWQLLAPIVIGARVRIVPEPASGSANDLLDATRQGGVTLLELTPSAAAALLDAGLARSPGALRIMIATGEALSGDLPRRWAREMPTLPLYNAYGPCECTDDVSIALSAWGPGTPSSVSIGRPLANTSMFILDGNLQPVPAGVAGWICVGGAGVGRGYLGAARRTAEVFVPDPWSQVPGSRLYWTGDLGRMTADGAVEFLGRADNQVKVRGIRIECGEVEAAVRECDRVIEAAVKVEHGPAGPFLVCFAVMGDGEPGRSSEPGRPVSREENERLRAALGNRLPRHMIPSVFVPLPRIPRTPNGKIDYRGMSYTPAEASDEHESDHSDDSLSAAIRSIWARHLGRNAVAWQDDFFQLGGHSLAALSMADQVARAAGLEVGVDLVFAYPRFGDFVAAIRRSPRCLTVEAGGPDASCSHNPSVTASAAQQRFWFLHALDPESPAFNMPGVLRLRGPLDDAALEAALREALDRHPVLLSRFHDLEGTLTWTPTSTHEFVLRRLDLRGAVAELGEEVFEDLANTEASVPIDLGREVPFRAMLAQLGSSDWRLFVCIHHIACDAWSLKVFLSDLAEAYNRRVRGLPIPAMETKQDFADVCQYELAQRERRGSLELDLEWRILLRKAVRLSPRLFHAIAERQTKFAGTSFSITGESATALREFAGRTGTTPFMIFATALSALIHSGSDDRETIVIGTLIAQRQRTEWRRVVGPLLNVSILVIDLALRDRTADALRRTRDAALRAYRSRNVPYQDLIGLLEPVMGAQGTPFEVLLVMQPEPGDPIAFDDLITDLVELEPGASPYPLVIDIEPRDAGYRVTHRFAPDRYDGADIEDLSARFKALTCLIVMDTDRTLEEVLRQPEILRVEGSRGAC